MKSLIGGFILCVTELLGATTAGGLLLRLSLFGAAVATADSALLAVAAAVTITAATAAIAAVILAVAHATAPAPAPATTAAVVVAVAAADNCTSHKISTGLSRLRVV